MPDDEGALGVFQAQLERRQEGLKAKVIGHLPLLQGHVQIGAKENVFAFQNVRIKHKLIIARQRRSGPQNLTFIGPFGMIYAVCKANPKRLT